MDARPFRFLYQDESGDVGRGQPHFIVGLLMVREREPLWAGIRRARGHWHYANELHFGKVSNLRIKVYEAVLDAIAVEAAHFRYEALAVPREDVNVGLFADRRHLAYNYFTKLVLEHRCQGVENAVMYADAKRGQLPGIPRGGNEPRRAISEGDSSAASAEKGRAVGFQVGRLASGHRSAHRLRE